MKILLLTPWYPNVRFPLEGSFVESQALALRRQGVDVRVACLHLSPFEVLKPMFRWYRPRFCREKDLPLIRIEGPFLPKRNALFTRLWAQTLSRILSRILRKEAFPQLLHAHTYQGAIAAYFLHQKTGIPYVITLHESLFLEKNIPGWVKKVLRPALKGASHIMCVSTALKENLLRHFELNTPVSAIPNNINLVHFHPSTDKPAPPPFRWIAVGDLKPIKQYDRLIRAFHHLHKKQPRTFQLTFVGYGPERKRLEALSRQLGLQDRIHFRGYLSAKAVPVELRQAHALVLSSRAETFGIVLAEALACGLPVVSTDCFGPRDIVRPEVGVLVAEKTAKALAEGMWALYQNYDDFDSRRIREYAAVRFGDNVVSEKIIEIYNTVCGTHGL